MILNLAHLAFGCRTLGPGVRAVLWVQGCARRCPGCVAGPLLPDHEVSQVNTEALADRILSEKNLDGVTFSGGEPFDQAEALTALADRLRAARDLSLLSYSGYTLAELREDPRRAPLLDRLDLLIDGPFQEALRADLLWRGSSNQVLHRLSPRHSGLDPTTAGAGVQLLVRGEDLFWMGVPPPGFQAALSQGLAARGVRLTPVSGIWS